MLSALAGAIVRRRAMTGLPSQFFRRRGHFRRRRHCGDGQRRRCQLDDFLRLRLSRLSGPCLDPQRFAVCRLDFLCPMQARTRSLRLGSEGQSPRYFAVVGIVVGFPLSSSLSSSLPALTPDNFPSHVPVLLAEVLEASRRWKISTSTLTAPWGRRARLGAREEPGEGEEA